MKAEKPNKAQEEVRDFILAARAEGKLVVMGIEGLMSMKLDEFVTQPADGMLYDLNRGEETSLTFIHEKKWVNDFAVALVIRKLVEQRDAAMRHSEAKGPEWKRILGDELPSGPPVDDGTTLYTFDEFPGHWEYELPPVPTRSGVSEGSKDGT